MNAPLHVKYRPENLDEVIGQKEVVASLRGLLKKKSGMNHAFLFIGPSGCGKTTLARIIAHELQCDPVNIIEVDAASNNGIDDVRALTAGLKYTGFGNPVKMIIIDEAHGLSKNAWTALLKSIEEPPEHVFFAFCTTDGGKVPSTIQTRCVQYLLKSVTNDELLDLLEFVCDEEGFDTPKNILSLVARSAKGSPRAALVKLAAVSGISDREEAATILEELEESAEIIDLCRKLLDRSLRWSDAVKILKALPENTSPESIRIVVVNYLSGCLMNPKSEKDVPRILDLLSSFSSPCNPTDKMAPILLAIGNHVFPPN